MRHLEIVATLGPASEAPATLAALARVVDRFRLNASHLDVASLQRWLLRLRAELPERRPVVVDLQGAKMRVGDLLAPLALRDRVVFTPAPPTVAPSQVDVPHVVVPHPALFAAVAPGERLWLDDARIEVVVESAAPERIEARVTRPGLLQAHKGINRPAHPVPLDVLSARDAALIAVARAHPGVELACSFVHDGHEAALLRAAAGDGVRLLAKLERVEAFDHLRAIAASFDELWLCRGDLGSQAGLLALGPLQARFVAALPTLQRPALLAGQVLEHLTTHATPTRSELVHLYDVAQTGFHGIVLSDETAIGTQLPALIAFLTDLRDAAR